MDLKVGPDQATDEEAAAILEIVDDPAMIRIADRMVRSGHDRKAERRHLLLPGLHALQRVRGWVSPGGLNLLCERLGVPVAEAYGVATFYDLIETTEQPAKVARVCEDIACRINKAKNLDRPLEDVGHAQISRVSSPCLGQCDYGGAALIQEVGSEPQVVRAATSHDEPVVEAPKGALLLKRIGGIDPSSLDEYCSSGGFDALEKAFRIGPQAVIDEIVASGLRGRGGAAFPAGIKWQAVADEQTDTKYVVANADESEPGTFKDRVLMEGDPFALIESLTIAGFATGASKGWIYVRGEYPLAASRLQNAVDMALAAGLLGDSILQSDFSFSIEIRQGAGAYICGEETALFNSIEGYRGEPRNKPPFPTTHGLFGKPTVINNVETLLNVPGIVLDGGGAFAKIGKGASTGTRLFCLSGRVKRPGVYEYPMGVSLREVIDGAGGVVGAKLVAVLLGGAAGKFLAPDQLDLLMTFEDTQAASHSIGSGVVFLIDETIDLEDLTLRLGEFFKHESCGQCVPCRIGTQRQYELLRAGKLDRTRLDDLATVMKDSSICGLGHTASSAIISALDLGLIGASDD